MKFDVKSLLKDRNVLYVVLFIAVTNVFGYLMVHNFDAVVFFLVVGFLTSYFSKNMIIVMLTAIISTNLLIGTRGMRKNVEGMGTLGDKKGRTAKDDGSKKGRYGDTGEDTELEPKEPVKDALTPLRPASASLDEEEGTGKKPKLDYAATLEAAYDNLDNVLSSGALRGMSEDTQGLIAKQQKLMENIKNVEPMMDKVTAMMDKLSIGNGGIDELMGKVTSSLDKLGVGVK